MENHLAHLKDEKARVLDSLSLNIVKMVTNRIAERVKNNLDMPQFLLKVLFRSPSKFKKLTNNSKLAQIARAVAAKGSIMHEDFYINRHYRVYLQGGDKIGGYGVEMGFGMQPHSIQGSDFNPITKELISSGVPAYVSALEAILNISEAVFEDGIHAQTVPISLRFVKGSNAFISPQYGEDTCMIELLNIIDTHGGKEMLYRFQNSLFKYGGRPHWGLDLSTTTGNNGLMKKMYPQSYDKWMKAFEFFNRNGTFNNRFTDRMGFSVQDFER